MTVVVSDTSPVRALAHLELLHLLPELFDVVVIPPAVRQELAHPRGKAAGVQVGELPYVRIQAPSDRSRVDHFLQLLDQGESEALALAEELQPDAVLIDEALGRQVAQEHGLPVVGTLAILLDAKQQNLIGPLLPLLGRLQHELGFFVSERLRRHVLRQAGEI